MQHYLFLYRYYPKAIEKAEKLDLEFSIELRIFLQSYWQFLM